MLKGFWGLVLLLGVLLPQKLVLADSGAICPNNLPQAIDEVVNRPEWMRSRWGILIESLDNEQIIYSLDAQKYFIPASNVKLLTTAAALRKLGSQYRIHTDVYGIGKPPNLLSLRVVGRGDPTVTTTQLRDLARQLKAKGVRHISQLIVEDGYFKDLPINPSWEWSDLLFYYAPSVNSLILNENTFAININPQQVGEPLSLSLSDPIAAKQWTIENETITTDETTETKLDFQGTLGKPIIKITGNLPVNAETDITNLAIADPANYFLESFRNILIQEGITVDQSLVDTKTTKEMGQKLGSIESQNLVFVINKTNQDSNNLYAEVLMRLLGSNSNKNGLEVIKESLTELGVNPDSYNLVDGSGLSRQNLVSPEALVKTLILMVKTPEGNLYRNSLAVAGVSGTLQGRFKDTAIVGNLQGKTGTLTGAVALSGYINVSNYQPLVFSIIVNNSDDSASNLRAAIDEIVILISRLHRC